MTSLRIPISLAWMLVPAAASAQTHLFTTPGAAAGDGAGQAVAFVGDVDADGAEDHAVGSPFHDTAGGSNAGRVVVRSGSTGLLLHAWHGVAAGELFGGSVAGAGDVDLDGHADVLVGARGGSYADVLSGRTGAVLHHLVGAASTFGQTVAGGGDVDGDGVPDLLVAAPEAGNNGHVSVYSGASGGLIRGHVRQPTFGWSLAFLGDLDGDGRAEYVAGEPGNFHFLTPAVHAFDGATGTLLWSDSGAWWNEQYGWSVARIGDVTGDGVPDVLAGAPQDPGVGCGGCLGKGYVRLLDGLTGIPAWQIDGSGFYAGLGFALTALGDLDGDGREDFAAGQPATEGCGGNTQAVLVRSGFDGAPLVAIPRPSIGDNFGYSLAAGDANDDGLRDLLIGAPCADLAGTNSGAVHAYTVVRIPTPYCEAKVNSQGCVPVIGSTGEPSLTTNTFRVRASQVINNKNGLLFWGSAPFSQPFQGGFKCVGSPVVRTPLQASGGNPPPDDCSGAFVFHFSGAYMSGHGQQPGSQIFCQYWARDPAAATGTSLTGGLAFLVGP